MIADALTRIAIESTSLGEKTRHCRDFWRLFFSQVLIAQTDLIAAKLPALKLEEIVKHSRVTSSILSQVAEEMLQLQGTARRYQSPRFQAGGGRLPTAQGGEALHCSAESGSRSGAIAPQMRRRTARDQVRAVANDRLSSRKDSSQSCLCSLGRLTLAQIIIVCLPVLIKVRHLFLF